MWIKVEGETFYIENINIQYTLFKYSNILIEIDIKKHDYYSYFINVYDNNRVFNMSFSNDAAKELDGNYLAVGCHIKTMDIIFNTKININIVCNKLKTDISEKRDEILEQILEIRNDEDKNRDKEF
jgi:hypothetical protein